MEKKERLAVEDFSQSFNVVKTETIVSSSTTIRTRPSSALLPVQNIESQNNTADEKKGANEESQTLRNSIDNQTDLQSLSKSTMSQSVSDDILNSTPNVDENLLSSSHSSGNWGNIVIFCF